MAFMTGRLLSVLVIVYLSSISAQAATLDFHYDNKTINFNITFEKDFNIIEHLKYGNTYKIKVKTNEVIDNLSKEFWGYPIERVVVKHDNNFYVLFFEFVDEHFDAEIKRSGNTLFLNVTFTTTPVNFEFNTGGIYLRIFIGTLGILIFIFLIYGFIKIVFKSKTLSNIPGVGRVLGKIDLTYSKSLFFYELGMCIYIIGVTSDSIALVDKITDTTEINIIKGGFSRKREFSSYLRFFGKKAVKQDLDITKNILEEKIESLRKK